MFFGELTSAVDDIELGDADPGVVSNFLVHLTDNSSAGASITVETKIRESQKSAAFKLAAYLDMADHTWKATAITSFPAVIMVDASGMIVNINGGTLTGGGVFVEAIPLRG
jgi:hypothetical protein